MASPSHPGGATQNTAFLLAGLLAATLFLLIGLALLPYPGLQNDECLFVQPLFAPIAKEYKINTFHHNQAVMLMNYLGTLKTWIYAAIFALWKPTVWSIRVPSLVIGSLTVWLFALFLKRVCGTFGAICGTFLLALDPSFLLTSVFDWGPVAFQHLLLVTALLAFRIFWESQSAWALASAFLSLGLAMWDKALFSWTLGGMFIAAILLFARDIIRLFNFRRALIATGAFIIGAWPFLLYNVRSQGGTFRETTNISMKEILPKSTLLWATLNGYGLFGYLSYDQEDKTPRDAVTTIEKASSGLRYYVGYHRQSDVSFALGLVLLAVPFWRKRWKVMAFAGITSLIAWILMTATKGAGGSVHHVVLFWPLPQLMLAVGLAGIAEQGKWLMRFAAVVTAVLCVQNFLVLNQTFYDLFRHGEGDAWSDAINPLYRNLQDRHPAHVNMMDWGFEYNLMALSDDGLPTRWGAEPGEREVATDADRRLLVALLEDANSVWVYRKVPIEVNPGTIERFVQRAKEQGYRQQLLDTVRDRNGRDTFNIYSFVREGK